MSRWYPGNEEVIVPWNARYTFPSQANRTTKITPRISPKAGSEFDPGQVVRFEFPAQGYVNPKNTTFAFDVTLIGYGTITNQVLRFQNNIQSIFQRVRVMYGATPLEDILEYNQIVRCLTEWTGNTEKGGVSSHSIAAGIGGTSNGTDRGSITRSSTNIRQYLIQGFDQTASIGATSTPNRSSGDTTASKLTSSRFCTRRYSVSLSTGLFTQDKLLPVKFMASQLAIEFTLENIQSCVFVDAPGSGTLPTYVINNFVMVPEILEFDAAYDAMFLKGLQNGGVPIQFSTWHTYKYSTGGGTQVNLQIPERSRSVKSLFAIQRRPADLSRDSHACLFDSSNFDSNGNTMQEYQWRIGGRYFPASPVKLSLTTGGTITNGGSEAFIELQKALNTIDRPVCVNAGNWALPIAQVGTSGSTYAHMDYDYQRCIIDFTATGTPQVTNKSPPESAGPPSVMFSSSIDLETSNGAEISGLNAEEQSDIAFNAKWALPQLEENDIIVFAYVDCMLIMRENNVVELIK